jgi:hypothetical protein
MLDEPACSVCGGAAIAISLVASPHRRTHPPNGSLKWHSGTTKQSNRKPTCARKRASKICVIAIQSCDLRSGTRRSSVRFDRFIFHPCLIRNPVDFPCFAPIFNAASHEGMFKFHHCRLVQRVPLFVFDLCHRFVWVRRGKKRIKRGPKAIAHQSPEARAPGTLQARERDVTFSKLQVFG